MELAELKSRMLKLLEEDEEFRYAVAGLIGLGEVLKRLDGHGERMVKLEERMVKLEESMVKLEKRMVKVEERTFKLEERMLKVEEELVKLREDTNKLRRDMIKGFKLIDKRLRYVEAYVERAGLTLEEEAVEVIAGELSRRGVKVKLGRLALPDVEVDIYGAADDLCVIGEAATRAGVKTVKGLDGKLERLVKRHPEYVRRRTVKVIYTMWITQEAVEEARKRNIWVLKATQELTPLIL